MTCIGNKYKPSIPLYVKSTINICMKRIFICLLLSGVLAVQNGMAQSKAITLDDVKEMLSAGLETDIILSQIQSNNAQFTLSVQDLLDLKKLGASTELIKELQAIDKVANELQGIYYEGPDGNVKINYTVMSQKAKSGIGGLAGAVGGAVIGHVVGKGVGAAVGAVAGASTEVSTRKSILDGGTSHCQIKETEPAFMFYFPKVENDAFQAQNGADALIGQFWGAVQSPNEFALIKLNKKKSTRTLPDGMSVNVLAAASFTIPAKSAVDFNIEQINNYTFKVTVPGGLEPGEYAFYYRGNTSSFLQNQTAYDFTITE